MPAASFIEAKLAELEKAKELKARIDLLKEEQTEETLFMKDWQTTLDDLTKEVGQYSKDYEDLSKRAYAIGLALITLWQRLERIDKALFDKVKSEYLQVYFQAIDARRKKLADAENNLRQAEQTYQGAQDAVQRAEVVLKAQMLLRDQTKTRTSDLEKALKMADEAVDKNQLATAIARVGLALQLSQATSPLKPLPEFDVDVRTARDALLKAKAALKDVKLDIFMKRRLRDDLSAIVAELEAKGSELVTQAVSQLDDRRPAAAATDTTPVAGPPAMLAEASFVSAQPYTQVTPVGVPAAAAAGTS